MRVELMWVRNPPTPLNSVLEAQRWPVLKWRVAKRNGPQRRNAEAVRWVEGDLNLLRCRHFDAALFCQCSDLHAHARHVRLQCNQVVNQRHQRTVGKSVVSILSQICNPLPPSESNDPAGSNHGEGEVASKMRCKTLISLTLNAMRWMPTRRARAVPLLQWVFGLHRT